MSLAQRLAEYVAAAFTGLWVQSHEHADALAEVARLCRDRSWAFAAWDVDRGLQVAGQAAANTAADPVAAIKSINGLATPDGSALLVLSNFHRLLGSAEVVQALAHQIQQGKTNRTFVLILSPVVQVPVELEKHFVVLDHDLPDRPQLTEAARHVVPVAVTAAESVERLRAWAAGRCLSAAHPGVYARGTAEPPASTGRRVARPSSN